MVNRYPIWKYTSKFESNHNFICRKFGPFLPFYPIFVPKNQNFQKMNKTPGDTASVYQKSQSWHVQFLRYSVDNLFLNFGPFLPFYPIFGPKNKNFQKMKKASGDIIIFHKCTKNNDHTMHGLWVTGRDGRTDRRKKWHNV